MSNFRLTSNNRQSGKIVYNTGIVQNIVALAVAEVEGVVPNQSKREGVSLYLEKDGVYVDISVVVKYGYNVPDVAYRVQQTVKQSVENMTHYKLAEVNVHIQDVVFGATQEPEKVETSSAEKDEKEQNKQD